MVEHFPENYELFDFYFSFWTSEIEILELNADQKTCGMKSGRLQRRSKMTSQKSILFDHAAMVENLVPVELFTQAMDGAEVLHVPRYNIELGRKNITSDFKQVLS